MKPGTEGLAPLAGTWTDPEEIRVDIDSSYRVPQGPPIAPFDLQIAAITQANGCIVVTGSSRRFEGIAGLETENWIR